MTTETLHIEIQQVAESNIHQVDFDNLVFGKYHADHMFVADYANGEWQNLRVVPYANLSLSPATAALHYGQSIFEGMKAYKNDDNEVLLFRPLDNLRRLNRSAERMCMPTLPEEIFMAGLETLLRIDGAWVPTKEDCSLYVRPYMFATDPYIGVRPSDNYTFIIFTSPVGKYYSKPPRVKVETQYIRAAEGGVGAAKCAGNYAASLHPAKLAQQQGYDQLIWTDAREHAYIEESGTMNVMFSIDGKLITPAVSDTILNGVTRKSIVEIARHWGIPVEERRVSLQEVIEAIQKGQLEAAFGAGTAVVVSPFAVIGYDGIDYELPALTEDSFAIRAKKFLTEIRTGQIADPFGWVVKI
ncbi:MAG: branched-chain amino acid aminotransferase [Runella slithyformis]|nr:MAG: branched-chain amino acid aminotransferase [Runella slithyformis]TAF02953.1 MAG: branched-chain amino acid aminotransferase [Runella slithyformis]TAF28579.1 MAG: branched-chain amino acid aminotransferase [Runella slithyformis]TAF47606.1 MAG: branched-chain amino acid aminotransferase [Runella slithyformis]TAF78415.1 MAG: branched-chain amino acid aminotransferase [Runella slithyformis]